MGIRICPSCGGKVAESRSECIHCGYVFPLLKKCPECEENVNINEKECPICGHVFEQENKSTIDLVEKHEESVVSENEAKGNNVNLENETTSDYMVAKFNKNATKEQFLRSVFLQLSKDKDSPIDVMNAKFGEVVEREIQGFAVYGIANGNYSASVGYDRLEEYMDEERVYGDLYDRVDSLGNKYKRVTKTRTVTDWCPHSGNVTNQSVASIALEIEAEYMYSNFSQLLGREDLNSLHDEFADVEPLPSCIYNEGINKLKQAGKNSIHLPGDRVQDVSCNLNISEYKIYRCIVPMYVVSYEYDGKNYAAFGFAINGITPIVDIPKVSLSAPTEASLRDQEKKEKSKAYKHSGIVVSMWVLAFFSCAAGLSMVPVLWIIGFSVMAVSIFVAISLNRKMSKKYSQIGAHYNALIKKLEEIKGIMYIKKLAEYGIPRYDETSGEYPYDGISVKDENNDIDIDSYLNEFTNPTDTEKNVVPVVKEKRVKSQNKPKSNKKKLFIIVSSIIFLALIVPFVIWAVKVATLSDGDTFKKDGITYKVYEDGGEKGLEIIYCSDTVKGDIVIPDKLYTLKVTSIGNDAFMSRIELRSIVIPSSVTSIGYGAFMSCSELRSIVIPSSVTSIGDYAFDGCSSLTSVEIPEGVTSIGDRAFYECRSLTSITIPSSVTSIGKSAFFSCNNIRSIIIPSSVTSIGHNAFYDCWRLTVVYYTGTEEQWNDIYIVDGNDPLTSATITYNYIEE